MPTDNWSRERRILAWGSALAIFGTVGVAFTFLFGAMRLSGLVVYPIAFLFAIAAGVGTALCICNLARLKDT